MTTMVEKIVLCHESLSHAEIPHAFGGALALAWCTFAARGTIDIDMNIFVETHMADQVFHALPTEVSWTKADVKKLVRDTQIRVFWDATPLDIFLNSTPYHVDVQTRIRWESFANSSIPFLSCKDVAVFKAFFNRGKDWVDIEEMQSAGTLDIPFVTDVLRQYLGSEDERVERLRALIQ